MPSHSLAPLSLFFFGLAAHSSPVQQAGSSFRLEFRRLDPRSRLTTSGNATFDPTFVTREIKEILEKYANADQFLAGIGLNPDTHPEAGYGNFSKPPSFLAQPAVGGPDSTHVLHGGSANTTGTPGVFNTTGPKPKLGTSGQTMPLTDYISGTLDIEYYGSMGFGTPAQALDVIIDTGSSDLWVPARCASCPQTEFMPEDSSTFKDTGPKCAVGYAKGDVSGRFAEDVVSVGQLTVSNQTFCAARRQSEDFDSGPTSGLLGLAFGSIAVSRKPTFFENLLEQKRLDQAAFSVYMTRKKEQGSEICFGCYDASKAQGKVDWHELVSRTYWSIGMDGLSVQPSPSSADTSTLSANLTAAIDTGTTLIYLPSSVANSVYDMIPGSKAADTQYGPGFYTFPCGTNATPTISLGFSGQTYAIYPADFNLGTVEGDPSSCVGGILALSADSFPSDLAIVGAEFLKSWYTVFDYQGRVGFAPSINNPPTQAPSHASGTAEI